MRILIFTNIYPSTRFPASGRWLAEQVRSLRNRGLKVGVLSFDPRGLHLEYGLMIPRLVRAIRSQSWDVIHAHHTYTILIGHLARWLARAEIALIGTIHEQEALDNTGITLTWKPTDRLRHNMAIKRLAAEVADVRIFVSSGLAAAVSGPQPYEVIPCGVDTSLFSPMDRGSSRRKLGIDPDAFVIFWPSDPRAPRKRLELARATFEDVRRRIGAVVLIVGGNIAYRAMPVYYNAADVVLQTSALEVSPTIVKEALACEVPLVSTRAGDTEDICRGLPNCLIRGDNSAELAEAIVVSRGMRVDGGRERLHLLGLGLDQVAGRLIVLYRQAQRTGMPT